MSNFKVEKHEEYKGFEYVVLGLSMGHRCDYVGIEQDNQFYGKSYDKIDLYAHGGLTFSDGGSGSKYPIESNKWWIGFDCAHYNDAKDYDLLRELCDEKRANSIIEIEEMYPTGGVIRTCEYIEQNCKELIDQIIESQK